MAIQQSVFTFSTFVTGTTITPALNAPGCWLSQYLVIPTMTTGYAGDTQVWIRGSADNVNYYRLVNIESNTNVVGANDFVIASATSQRIVYIPSCGFNFLKVEISGAVTNNIGLAPQFKIICVSNQ